SEMVGSIGCGRRRVASNPMADSFLTDKVSVSIPRGPGRRAQCQTSESLGTVEGFTRLCRRRPMAEATAAGRGIASPYHVAKKVNVMRAAEIMTRPVITVQPNTPLRDAVHELVDNGFAGLPVVDE